MCGAEKKFPKQIDKIKTPRNLDCSDPFNLNVLQRILMYIFDRRMNFN